MIILRPPVYLVLDKNREEAEPQNMATKPHIIYPSRARYLLRNNDTVPLASESPANGP